MFGRELFFSFETCILLNAQIWTPLYVCLKFGLLDLIGLHSECLKVSAEEKERNQLDKPQMIKKGIGEYP